MKVLKLLRASVLCLAMGLGTQSLHAEYYPEGTTWSVLWTAPTRIVDYEIGGDTLIEGRKYKQILCDGAALHEHGWHKGYFSLREAGDSVFVYSSDFEEVSESAEGKERLLYCFSWQEGKETEYRHDGLLLSHPLTGVISVRLSDGKNYELWCPGPESAYFLRGIGSWRGILAPFYPETTSISQPCLYSFTRKGEPTIYFDEETHLMLKSKAYAILSGQPGDNSGSEADDLQRWAMAVVENGQTKPVIVEYSGETEQADNGITYYRIIDESYRTQGQPYNPVKLQYGYRLADKQIYIYDFEAQKETLAFDFTLSSGARFTTFNGMEWTVVSARDTLVNISFCGKGESVPKRLLAVKTSDGQMTDQWLEDFGSFTNHFMINSLEGVKFSQTLWMEYAYGEYLARELNADPFYAHDTGWMDGTYSPSEKEETRFPVECGYDNGQVILENVRQWYEGRFYSCFYRDGEDIYRIYSWELEPHADGGTPALRLDEIRFLGLPAPSDGKYTVHNDISDYLSSIGLVGLSPRHAPSDADRAVRLVRNIAGSVDVQVRTSEGLWQTVDF